MTLNDKHRRWLAIGTVLTIFASVIIISVNNKHNGDVKENVNENNAKIVKLNKNIKNTNTKPKIKVDKQLPTIYKQAMLAAKDITEAQNTLSSVYQKNNGKWDKNDKNYQSAYSTMMYNVSKDNGSFDAQHYMWAANPKWKMHYYPGSFDGDNTYKLLFTFTDDNGKLMELISGNFKPSDKTVTNLERLVTTDGQDHIVGGDNQSGPTNSKLTDVK